MKRHINAKFSISVEQEITDYYKNQGLGTTKLAENFNTDPAHIRRILNYYQVPIRSQSDEVRRYTLNPNSLDNPNDEKSAYWLGFIYADGHCDISINSLTVNLSWVDYSHLEKLKEFFSSTYPIKDVQVNSNNKQYRHASLRLTHKHLTHQLICLGLNKPKNHSLLISRIPPSMYRHWFRGFFDGDGCVGKTHTNFSLCGPLSLMEWCRNLLHQEIGTRPDYPIQKNTKSSIRYFQIGGRLNILKIADWMYRDSSIFLPRKKEIFDNYRH